MRKHVVSGAAGLVTARHILVAADESHLLSMQLTLDAHGVRHTAYRHHTEGVTKYAHCIAVDAADFDRAATLVGALQVNPRPGATWNRASFRLFAAVATLLVVGVMLLLLLMPHP
jgi:Flp pilus assembly protein TadB